jgi:hypothetical protein
MWPFYIDPPARENCHLPLVPVFLFSSQGKIANSITLNKLEFLAGAILLLSFPPSKNAKPANKFTPLRCYQGNGNSSCQRAKNGALSIH